MNYNSSILEAQINSLVRRYPFLLVGSIGNSVLFKKIPYIKIGNGKKEVFYNGSFHANEWITSVVLMEFAEKFCEAYKNNTNIFRIQC